MGSAKDRNILKYLICL